MTPNSRRLLCLATLLALLVWTPLAAETAATHKHEHTHSHHNKERLADGSYAPRDANHHSHDDGGDDSYETTHNNEFDHEAILGSVRAAEEFDQLPPAEAKKRLRVLVRQMDLNSDGFIDRHELKVWILRSFVKLAEEEAEDRFADVDQNRDGKITWGEHMLETYNMENENVTRDPETMPQAEEEVKMIADDRRMFAAADVNSDGVLSGEEYVAFVSPEEFAHMLPVILEQTLKDKDKNGDGKIDFQEYVGNTAANHDKEWLLAEKDKFDEDYDLDKDGSLNGNEILSWVVPSNDEVATEEVSHLFVAADENHDDRLSYQEIIDNSATFVGSEATNYGENLYSMGHVGDEL